MADPTTWAQRWGATEVLAMGHSIIDGVVEAGIDAEAFERRGGAPTTEVIDGVTVRIVLLEGSVDVYL